MARVLLVDDDTTGLEIRRLLFEHAGHRVVAASDPVEALALCGEDAFDAAIVDVRLPAVGDGLALLRDLRRRHSALRLIVLCGDCSDLEGRPERDYVDEIFAKPVRAEKLLAAVKMKSS
ncbi:MAG TPA: response regulator [Bryobacteraceae bacterium]|jgi:CheY-like chemotaxis protein